MATSDLERWYRENHARVEGLGFKFTVPLEKPVEYIDGVCGRYMFRFIDRRKFTPDIEIIDTISSEKVEHNLPMPHQNRYSIFDIAIDFICKLSSGSQSPH